MVFHRFAFFFVQYFILTHQKLYLGYPYTVDKRLLDGQPVDQNTTVDGIFCYKQTTSVFLLLRHWRVMFDMLPPLILTNEEKILSI
jgi:hypothetical protein